MPVDSYPEGVSGFGVYNMAGNVFEWVEDWYDPKFYKESIALNPQRGREGLQLCQSRPGQGAARRVVAGSGDFASHEPPVLESAGQ